jgi:hypothetical protein
MELKKDGIQSRTIEKVEGQNGAQTLILTSKIILKFRLVFNL